MKDRDQQGFSEQSIEFNRRRTRGAEGLDRFAWTVADIDRLTALGVFEQSDRFELIDGEIVPLSPIHVPHGGMVMRLGAALISAAPGGLAVNTASLIVSNASQFDPDLSVHRTPLADGQRVLLASDVVHLIEVSDTTLEKDLGVKADHYARAGIAEYWVVDLNASLTHVHADPDREGRWRSIHLIGFDQPLTPRWSETAICLDTLSG